MSVGLRRGGLIAKALNDKYPTHAYKAVAEEANKVWFVELQRWRRSDKQFEFGLLRTDRFFEHLTGSDVQKVIEEMAPTEKAKK